MDAVKWRIENAQKQLDAALALIDDAPSIDFIWMNVPYHSQWEADARTYKSDCGPACVEMVGEYHRGPKDTTTNEIMRWITGGPNCYTSVTELQRAAKHFYGVTLRRVNSANWRQLKEALDELTPCIVLVHYGSFGARLDRRFTGGHFMVAVGHDEVLYQDTSIERMIVHDPDWWGDYTAQGAFFPIPHDHFMPMWSNCHLDGNPDYLMLVAE